MDTGFLGKLARAPREFDPRLTRAEFHQFNAKLLLKRAKMQQNDEKEFAVDKFISPVATTGD